MRMIHRLPELLAERGMKKKIADAVDTDPSVITELCSGVARLNEDWIEKISKALGIPAWHLFADPNDVRKELLSNNDIDLDLIEDASLVLYEVIKEKGKDPTPEQFSKLLVQLCKVGLSKGTVDKSNVVDMFEFAEAMGK